MSMLEERIKRSAKKTPAAPAKQSAAERPQREPAPNPNATFLRKPQHEEPNKLKYVHHFSTPEFDPHGQNPGSSGNCGALAAYRNRVQILLGARLGMSVA